MNARCITVDLETQMLSVFEGDELRACYPVSTAANGAGERLNSECTPRGKHVIDEAIGAGCAPNTVFVGRRATGEIYHPELRRDHPERDWILTRILWLSGLEPGRNQGGEVDSKSRYIYIHGTPADTDIGTPGSRGCIRMRNEDIVELFEIAPPGTPVEIT